MLSIIIRAEPKRRDGLAIDNVGEALDRAAANGVKNLVIQPTHMMDGFEYLKVVKEAARYQDAFASLSIGSPLLTYTAEKNVAYSGLHLHRLSEMTAPLRPKNSHRPKRNPHTVRAKFAMLRKNVRGSHCRLPRL